MTLSSRRFEIGDRVVIPEAFGRGSGSWPGVVANFDAHAYCNTCHCQPANPEHLGDGSICCPGPFYMVASPCPDDPGHGEHLSAYAEHELEAGGAS